MNPPADLLNQKLWAWSPEIGVAKVMQVIPAHCVKPLITVYLKRRDRSSGAYATQSVTEVRVQFCKDRAIADGQAAAPARKSHVPARPGKEGGIGPEPSVLDRWVAERWDVSRQ